MTIVRITVLGVAAATLLLAGCATTLKPNYTSTNPDLMRIGGNRPTDQAPEVTNLGTYCLQLTERWKSGGKTPDGQEIWTKDTYRTAAECK